MPPSPTLTLISPPNGAAYADGSSIALTARAAGQPIRSVTFYANGVKIGTDDSATPYSRQFSHMQPGTYRITATGYDKHDNLITAGNTITITVGGAPPVPPPPDDGLSTISLVSLLLSVAQISTAGTRAATGETLTTYSLTWGDGTALVTGTGTPPTLLSHTYAAPGPYSAVLTVTDTGLHVYTSTPLTITVPPPTPVPNDGVVVLTLTSLLTGHAVVSTVGTHAATGATITTWSLDWLDGSSPTTGTGTPTASLAHDYATPGTYVAVLTIHDSAAHTYTGSRSIAVPVPPPPPPIPNDGAVALAIVDVTISQTRLSTTGTHAATGQTISTYTVNWGDGGPTDQGTGVPPSIITHVYATSGVKHPTLSITDSAAHVYIGTITVTVPSPTPPPPTGTLNWNTDFTYLGAYRAPLPTVGDMAYGNGLYLRRESSDLTQPVHIGSAAYNPATGWPAGTQRIKLSLRGTAISVYVDEGSGYPASPTLHADDSDITAAGKAGIGSTVGVGYAIDNFTATNAGGGVFGSDTFTGTNGTTLAAHTPVTGGAWTLHPTLADCTMQIQSNRVQQIPGNNAYYFLTGSPTNADYDVEADLVTLGGTTAIVVTGRMNATASTAYIAFYYNVGGNTTWYLAKIVAGVYTALAACPSPVANIGIAAYVYEWRDHTPEIPGSPMNPASYSTATRIKEFGNIYGSGPSKRIGVYAGAPYDFNDGKAGTLRFGSLFCDPSNNTDIYWTFGETYSNESGPYLGYSTLNYAAGTSTPHGAWTTAATQFKGGLTGVLAIPSSFVTATGLGTRRLATIGSPPASVQAAGDVSVGPQLTAFSPPIGVTEQTSLPSQRVVGYAPFTNDPTPGGNRAVRPTAIQWYQGAGSAVVAPYSNWPFYYWNGYDSSYGGVWIHGTGKSGFLTVQQMFKGQATYLFAMNMPQMYVNALSIMSETDLLAIAAGTLAANAAQPTTYELTWAQLNPADYVSTQVASVASVTSVAGTRRSVGATLTTTAPHGFGPPGTFGAIGVIGTSVNEYNDNWDYTVINTTQMTINNPSLDSFVFTGTAATGGGLWTVGLGLYPGTGIRILGLAFDELTSKLYLGYLTNTNVPMVAVWLVSTS